MKSVRKNSRKTSQTTVLASFRTAASGSPWLTEPTSTEPLEAQTSGSCLGIEFFLYENHRQIGPLSLDE